MIGVIVVTHGSLANELIAAIEFVIGGKPGISIMGVAMPGSTTDFTEFSKDISAAIKKVDEGDGVLLLTDMFGGTPSNVSLSFLEENRVEVISGVNLPMLLKVSTITKEVTLKEAVKIAEAAGKDNIIVATKLLKKKKSTKGK